jgi:hypothetical protein
MVSAMPEALAVMVVFAVCVVVYFVALFQSRDPARVDVREDFQQLQLHEAWLRERLHRAQREQWDADMIAGLAGELEIASRKLARTPVPVTVR